MECLKEWMSSLFICNNIMNKKTKKKTFKSGSKKYKRYHDNNKMIRGLEDHLLKTNQHICDYNMVKPITDDEIHKLCGDTMESLHEDLKNDDVEDGGYKTFKFVILNARKKITAVIIGHVEQNKLVDIGICSPMSKTIGGHSGGEILLYYALLKYNSLYNTKRISGYIAGAIPPIEVGDSQKEMDIKSQRLVDYHVKRKAKISIEGGNKKFTYTYDRVMDNCDDLLTGKGLHLKDLKGATVQLAESLKVALPGSDSEDL